MAPATNEAVWAKLATVCWEGEKGGRPGAQGAAYELAACFLLAAAGLLGLLRISGIAAGGGRLFWEMKGCFVVEQLLLSKLGKLLKTLTHEASTARSQAPLGGNHPLSPWAMAWDAGLAGRAPDSKEI